MGARKPIGVLLVSALLVACGNGANTQDTGVVDAADAMADAVSMDRIDAAQTEDSSDVATETTAVDSGLLDANNSETPFTGCAAGELRCGDRCVDSLSDPQNCGNCGMQCPQPRSGTALCLGGACALSCPAGSSDCNADFADGCEINTATDIGNCGVCGRTCRAPDRAVPVCRDGSCGFTCDEGRGDCDGDPNNGCETTTGNSINHCGMCGRACPAPPNTRPTCVAGACGFLCAPGFGNCDGNMANGCEAALNTASNCGACRQNCSGLVCASGTCATACPMGQTACGSACVDLSADPYHCGGCNMACPAPSSGVATCVGGRCGAACRVGFSDCDLNPANGCEVDLSSSLSNCGSCGNACPARPNAMPACNSGGCGIACVAGYGNCDSSSLNGCETRTSADPANCGGCGRVCAAAPNAAPSCANGACTFTCNAGFGNCDNNPANGCETSLNTTAACGACGRTCAAGQVCNGGQCLAMCPSSQTMCGSACVDVRSDPDHCGSCTGVCPARANGTRTCVSSMCGVACTAGFGNCDNNATNGCERVLGSDASNCGACGNVCPTVANSSPTCANGTCGITCNNGFANCDNNPMNGCEVPTTSDVRNCGGCGRLCPARANATNRCLAGTCSFLCNEGFADCDGDPANGCEVALTTTLNCGGCGRPCQAGQVCASGVCQSACPAGQTLCAGACVNTFMNVQHCGMCNNACVIPVNGIGECNGAMCGRACTAPFADCDGTPATCETNTQTSVTNCGVCGMACPGGANAAPRCSSGVCDFTCTTNFGDCDRLASNGCEANFLTSNAHCGACGNACSAGNGTCMNGTCRPTNDVCTSAQSLGTLSAGTAVVRSGHTLAGANESGGCSAGNDVFYSFTIASTRLVVARVAANFDAQVGILGSCSASPMYCNDSECGPNDPVAVAVLAPGTYTIVVDGAAAGTFLLDVNSFDVPAGSAPRGRLSRGSFMFTNTTSALGQLSCTLGADQSLDYYYFLRCPGTPTATLNASLCNDATGAIGRVTAVGVGGGATCGTGCPSMFGARQTLSRALGSESGATVLFVHQLGPSTLNYMLTGSIN